MVLLLGRASLLPGSGASTASAGLRGMCTAVSFADGTTFSLWNGALRAAHTHKCTQACSQSQGEPLCSVCILLNDIYLFKNSRMYNHFITCLTCVQPTQPPLSAMLYGRVAYCMQSNLDCTLVLPLQYSDLLHELT